MVYPNEDVASYINETFVPVQIELGKNKPLENKFGVSWTPTLLFMSDEKELNYKQEAASYTVDNFLPALKMGRARAIFNNSNYRKSLRVFDEVIEEHTGSLFEAEALYWSGVAKLKVDGKEGLMERWGRVKEDHPDSEWANRIEFV